MPITMPGPRPADDENPDDKPKDDTPLDDRGARPASQRENDLVRRLLDWDSEDNQE